MRVRPASIDPTPTVAMVGLIEHEERITTQFFKAAGDVVILLGDFGDEMGGSHFLKVIHGGKPAGRRGSTSSASWRCKRRCAS